MKKILLLCILFFSAIFVYSNSSSLQVQLLTDRNISYNDWNDISALENNSLVVIENGIETDKYTTKYGEKIEVLFVTSNEIKIRTIQNLDFTSVPSAAHWSDGIIIFSYINGKLSKKISYPEKLGYQSGPIIKLLNADFDSNNGYFSYSYQQYGESKYAGYGTIKFEIQKINDGYFYVTKYHCDVNGYFHLVDPDEDMWLPRENGEMVIKQDISKNDFFSLFPLDKPVIIYDTAIAGKICLVYENLRLRENENTSSSTIKIMKTGEYVKIIQVGKKEVIDGIPGNWCYVEIVEPKFKTDLTRDLKFTGNKGWCFSGYLK